MPTAPATITFAHVDPDRVATILAALRLHRFHAHGYGPVTAPLRMFTTYRVPDATTTISSGLGTLIRRLDRSSVFTLRQNLCGEFAGQQRISDPDLGDYLCALDEHGDELIAERELRHGIDTARHVIVAAGGSPVDALAELDRLGRRALAPPDRPAARHGRQSPRRPHHHLTRAHVPEPAPETPGPPLTGDPQ